MNPGKRIKRLTAIRVDEVSAVPHGAGEGVRVVLMKSDRPAYVLTDDGLAPIGKVDHPAGGKKRRRRFNDAGTLIPIAESEWGRQGRSGRLGPCRN
jgi:hypothetical protein